MGVEWGFCIRRSVILVEAEIVDVGDRDSFNGCSAPIVKVSSVFETGISGSVVPIAAAAAASARPSFRFFLCRIGCICESVRGRHHSPPTYSSLISARAEAIKTRNVSSAPRSSGSIILSSTLARAAAVLGSEDG